MVDDEKPLQSLSELHDKIKAENDRMEALVKRNEELAARNLLGGKTDAGMQPEPVKVLTPKEYKDQVMRGIIPQ